MTAPNGRGPAAQQVGDCLERCRQRVRRVAAVRWAAVLLPLALLLDEAIFLMMGPASPALAATMAVAPCAAILFAVAGAARTAPTLRETAALLDRRLRLQDRAVTALHVIDEADPVADLVLRDAAARLAAITPSRVFPFEWPARMPTIALAISGLAAAVAVWPGVRDVRSAATRGGGMAVGGERPGRTINSRPSPGAPPATPSEDLRAAAAEKTGPAPRTGAVPRPSLNDPRPLVPRPDRSERGARAPENGGPSGAESPSLAQGRRDGRETGIDKARDGSRGAGPASVKNEGNTAGRARGGGRGGASPMAGTVALAGGVSGGSLEGAVNTPSASVDATSGTYGARYERARLQAERAIAQEQVPAALRAYVRNYFVAIRP